MASQLAKCDLDKSAMERLGLQTGILQIVLQLALVSDRSFILPQFGLSQQVCCGQLRSALSAMHTDTPLTTVGLRHVVQRLCLCVLLPSI